MSPRLDVSNNGTVTFLPHRLNRQPIVVRGLTADELWLCAGLSAGVGLLAGLIVAWLLSSIAVLPTLMIFSIGAGVYGSGGQLRRYKRGRPETWLYRQLHWAMARRCPWLIRRGNQDVLITRSGYWSTRRGLV